MTNEDNGRTHEPSLRELTADLDGMRELLLAKIDASSEALAAADKRYEQRFIAQEGAVQSALVSQEKAVNAALIAADRAVTKVETANEKRFESVNEFRSQLADQAAGFLPRNESQIQFAGLTEKIDGLRLEIQSLRESRSEASGTPDILTELTKEIRSLRESRAETTGSKVQVLEQKQQGQWSTSMIVTIVFGILGTMSGIFSITYIIIRLASGH